MVTMCYNEFEKNLQDREPPDPTSYFTQTGYMIGGNRSKSRRFLSKIKGDYFFHAKRKLGDYKEADLMKQKELLQDAQKWLLSELDKIIEDSPVHITVYYDLADLKGQKGDRVGLKFFKFRKRTWSKLTGKPVSVKIPFKVLLEYHLPARVQTAIYSLFKAYGRSGFQHVASIQALCGFMKNSFQRVEERLIRGEFSHAFIKEEKSKALDLLVGNYKASGSGNNGSGSQGKMEKPTELQGEDVQLDLSIDEFVAYSKLPEQIEKLIYTSFKKSLKVIGEELKRVDIIGLLKKRHQLSPGNKDKLRIRLKGVPDKWYRNQVLFLNGAMMELMLISCQNQMGAMVQKMVGSIGDIFQQNVIDNLKFEYETLDQFSANIKIDPVAEFKVPVVDWGYARDTLHYKDMGEKLMSDIKELIGNLPEQIEIMGAEKPTVGKKSLKEYETNQYEKIETISIDLQRLVNFLVFNYLTETLRKNISQLPEYFNKTIGIAEDVLRLTSFSLNNTDREMFKGGVLRDPKLDEEVNKDTDPEGTATNGFQESILDFVNEGKTRVKNEMVKTKEHQKQVLSSLINALALTSQKLEPEQITESAGNLKEYIRKTRKRNQLLVRIKGLLPALRTKISRIWYSKSDSFLVARRNNISKESWSISAAPWNFAKNRGTMKMEEYILLLESVTPSNGVLDTLPFYYRQLFLGKQYVDRAFWTGRKNALAAAEKAVKWFKHGMVKKDGFGSGGLLIVGEQNSGKTYLSQYIAGKHFNKKQIFQISPPPGGSTDLKVLQDRMLDEILNNNDKMDKIPDLASALDKLQDGSVVIFNDLELWWERSDMGMEVIRNIMDLINHYGRRLFFIVNGNVHSLKQMKRLEDYSGSFLMEIPCEPFNAEELKDIILFRHKSTGLKYKLKHQREDDMTVWGEAKLFSRYFDYSKGNVGVALQSWISNIDDVSSSEKPDKMSYERNSGVLYVSEPQSPDLKSLKRMDAEWSLVIQQFILHNHLSPKKLSRVSGVELNIIGSVLKEMNKVGLIITLNSKEAGTGNNNGPDSVWELNPYILPHLVNDLVGRGLL